MFEKNKPNTDSNKGTGEDQRPIHYVANFSYPRTDLVHLYRKEQPGARDSQGSESSPPPLVEDHGSDLSAAEDDLQQLPAADVKMWKKWRAKEEKLEKVERRARTNPTGYQQLATPPAASPTAHCPPSSGSQSGQQNIRVVVPCPEQQRPQAPKPPPKGGYSLFPSASVSARRAHVPLPAPPTIPQQSGLAPSPVSPNFSFPVPLQGAIDRRNQPVAACRPNIWTAKAPGGVHGGSIAASSSDSIPLLLRSPGPTPPHSPPGTSSSSEAPPYPFELEKRPPPPETTLRDLPPMVKKATRSSPSLANLARAQRQGQAQEPLPQRPPTPTDIHDRPLPPLPSLQTALPRFPSPPNVSVFEPDTDDEDEPVKSRPSSSEARNFARRLMHGLVHHHSHSPPSSPHDRRDKGQHGLLLADHKRSVSDEGPSTAAGSSSSAAAGAGVGAGAAAKDRGSAGSGGSGGRGGFSRTLGAAARYRWGGTAASAGAEEVSAPVRGAVSMDLPRERVGEEGGRGRPQQGGDEGERGGRFLGRLLRRKG